MTRVLLLLAAAAAATVGVAQAARRSGTQTHRIAGGTATEGSLDERSGSSPSAEDPSERAGGSGPASGPGSGAGSGSGSGSDSASAGTGPSATDPASGQPQQGP